MKHYSRRIIDPVHRLPQKRSVVQLGDPAVLADLASDAAADGRGMVPRLIAEWSNGSNRFDRPGERAYYAAIGASVVAVCGLNVDPFANDPTVGRVRRLYVAVAHRRKGVASALINRLAEDARSHFQKLHLRTHDLAASAFYMTIGFIPVAGDANCTHCRTLVV